MTDTEKLSLINSSVLSRLHVLTEERNAHERLIPRSPKYTGADRAIEELERIKELIERSDG